MKKLREAEKNKKLQQASSFDLDDSNSLTNSITEANERNKKEREIPIVNVVVASLAGNESAKQSPVVEKRERSHTGGIARKLQEDTK